MTDTYQKQITNYVRDVIQQRITHLKETHPDQLYTQQWQLKFPNGFQEGNNVIPVITTTKDGTYCIGELHLVVPASYELDLEAIEFIPKNEPYQAPAAEQAPPLDTSLDMLNAMIQGLNDFIAGMAGQFQPSSTPSTTGILGTPSKHTSQSKSSTPSLYTSKASDTQVDKVRKAILQHDDLPQWFMNLRDTDIRDQLLHKMAETFLQYSKQRNGKTSLAEFFEDYTEYLKENDTLQDWCTYKAKPVELNSKGFCQETYCSKKPYKSQCPRATLKFAPSNTDE